MSDLPFLAPLFEAVAHVLTENRVAFNVADTVNQNHGDHMVQIFEVASRAAGEKEDQDLASAMAYTGEQLAQIAENGSAQIYALGLKRFAQQFLEHQVTRQDLFSYVRGLLVDEKNEPNQKGNSSNTSEVLKALVGGLAGWQQLASGLEQPKKSYDVGYLFDLGISYMQAKQRGGSKVEILADAAASVSPLSSVPYRYQSGKLAIQALLQAMSDQIA
jgi:hypothetical protein